MVVAIGSRLNCDSSNSNGALAGSVDDEVERGVVDMWLVQKSLGGCSLVCKLAQVVRAKLINHNRLASLCVSSREGE
jgi:hypothetical protein